MYKPHSTVKVQSLFILNAKHSHQIIHSQSVKGSTSLPLYHNAPNSPVNFKKHIFSTIILLYYSNIETHSAMALTLRSPARDTAVEDVFLRDQKLNFLGSCTCRSVLGPLKPPRLDW